MIKTKIVSIEILDRETAMPYIYDNENYIDFYVEAEIGEISDKHGELFTFHFCDVDYIKYLVSDKEVIYFNKLVLISKFSEELVEEIVLDFCSRMESKSWTEFARKMNNYSDWEFGNMDYNAV